MKHSTTAYNTTPLWEPVFVLPSQLPLRGNYLNTPEMHLVAAIFEDAVHCVLRNAGVRRGRGWYEYLEARDWIMDDRRDWPFAFANICELLTLDVTAVRESLREVLGHTRAKADSSRDERLGDPDGWNMPDEEQHLPGESEHERFEVVVWDEA
ncbi:MAG TPA: hypothetical protein VMW56_09090 [Candidatus Margulisiibacteriota bacterium]|nr:hypothetical protein [Candidatus Margulisiibacteriota bacterium]